MLAQAIAYERRSPPTSASCGRPISAMGSPSTSSASAAPGRRSTARRIASAVATRMLRRSISRVLAAPTPTGRVETIAAASCSRRRRVSCFESSTPSRRGASGVRRTAAATTGPASGPRPASSTPASRRTPRANHASSTAGSSTSTFALLPDPPRLAGEPAQVGELRAADLPLPHHLHRPHARPVQREDPLHAHARGPLPHRERLADPAAEPPPAHALERLEALLLPLLDAHHHLHGVAGAEIGQVLAQPLALDLPQPVHRSLPVQCGMARPQLRAPLPRQSFRFRLPPRGDPRVIARQQDLRHPVSPVLRRP